MERNDTDEPMWDLRKTAHRTGLMVVLIVYMALLALILYGHSVSRATCKRDLPLKILP